LVSAVIQWGDFGTRPMLAQLVMELPQDSTSSPASSFAASVPVPVDVRLAAGGDRAAFERVYRAHVDRVYSLCTRMMGDRGLAEELTQDVFVRVWEKLPSFRGDSAFATWLHRVAVNVILTRRKTVGIQESRVTNDEHAQSFATSRPVSVGDQLDLEAAIAGLPVGARRIFVLHDVEGFTHEEIGEQLGITAGGSKAQLHRARSLLRVALSR